MSFFIFLYNFQYLDCFSICQVLQSLEPSYAKLSSFDRSQTGKVFAESESHNINIYTKIKTEMHLTLKFIKISWCILADAEQDPITEVDTWMEDDSAKLRAAKERSRQEFQPFRIHIPSFCRSYPTFFTWRQEAKVQMSVYKILRSLQSYPFRIPLSQ